MEQNKIKESVKQKPNHSCINELRLNKLEQKDYKMEILKTVLTPKMFFSICLGLSMLLNAFKGV